MYELAGMEGMDEYEGADIEYEGADIEYEAEAGGME